MARKLLNKAILPIILLFLTSLQQLNIANAQSTPQFFNFNNGASTNAFPFSTADKRVQFLYMANEFTGAYSGKITRVYFRAQTTTTSSTYTNFIIRLGHTTLTSFATGTYPYVTPLTTVISSSSYVVSGTTAGAWVGFTLQTPFTYDNTKNLIIEVIQTTATGGWGIYNTAPASGQRRIYGASTATSGTGDGGYANLGFDVIKNSYNDAAVAAIDSPAAFCAGIKNIVVTVQNAGRNNISGLTINWVLDGVTQTPVSYSSTIDTINTKKMVTLGSLNFLSGVTHTLKVWTSNPNGVADTSNANDTMSTTFKPSLNGSFTIGGTSPDYPSITAAVADLNSYGICGPVTFTIRAGTYNQQVSLDQVEGASATNTITFDGVDPATRTITFAGTAANPHTFRLNGSDYVTLKNLTIANTGTANAFSLHLTAQADYNTIDNCVIRAVNTTTLTTIIPLGIMGATYTTYGNQGNYNKITNCSIDGGYANIVTLGTSASVFCNDNLISNCTLTGAYLYGIFSYYQSGNRFTDNDITARTTTNSYGIYAINNTNGFKFERNTIRSQYMGLYLSSCNTTGSLRASIANNIIYKQAYSTVYQIYFTTVNNTDVFHNTTYNTGPAGYNLYITAGSGNKVRNNIFVKTVAGTYCAYVVGVTSVSEMDYNNYYTTVAGNYVYLGVAYANLAALKTNLNYNQNSISAMPNFVSTTAGSENLHLTSGVPAPYGTNLSVTVDVDNDSRCLFAPTLGADESNYIVLAPVAGFILPDTIYVNSPTVILNSASANEAKAHNWYLQNAKISGNLHLTYTFGTVGTDTLKLVTESCGGKDSITKIFTVINPTRVPLSEFVSDKNQIAAFEDVQFTDLSTGGASQWTWSVIPAAGVTITSQNSQNPVMSFSLPGDYQVCLTAANLVGNGNSECKNAYIRVGDVQYMCSAPITSNASSGELYDSGGPLTPYAANENCSFLIDPCATSVTIKFNAFNLGNVGDELKIYDGSNITTGILLGTFTSTSGNPGGNSGITAASGKMLLVWKTDGATQGDGFVAEWSSVPANFSRPAVSFIMPDTAYIDQPVQFKSTTTGVYLNYSWDIDAPNSIPGDNGGFMDEEVNTYTSPGTYLVKLTVTNCGGMDTLTRPIVVLMPTSPPNPVDFKINFSRLTLQDTAQLTDLSGHGASDWTWSATPAAGVKFLPDNHVYNPRITVSAPGVYDIKLVVSNAIGADSLTKSSFIRVVSYCVPGVANLNNDAGISRVRLAGTNNTLIDNSSAIGVSGYTDYSQNGQNALLELGGNYAVEVSRYTTNNKINRRIWIDWNGDGDFNDPGEAVASESSAQTSTWIANFSVPGTASVGYARMRVGTNLNNLSNLSCGPNSYGEYEDYRVIVSEDISKPLITLLGSDTVYIEQYRAYADAGATASDQLNGNITADMYADPATVSTLNTIAPGSFVLTFNVKDSSGNAAVQRTRTVIVTPDTTRPVISVAGTSPMMVQVNTAFKDPGVTASDFRSSGNVPVIATSFNNVDTTVIGSYTVTYTAEDSTGNISLFVRTVEVTDTVKPVLVLIGSDPMFVEVKTPFTDPMVTVSDNYYPLSGLQIVSDATTEVNINVTGTYLVTYSVTDGSGNTGILTRSVIVQDTQKPIVVLQGLPVETVEVHSTTFKDPGAIVTDNYDNLTYSRIGTVNLSMPGDNTLRYFTADNSGNMSDTVDRIVRVVDSQKPVITMKGDDFVYIERWVPYIDSGATVADNYYTGMNPVVTQTGNTLKLGIFFVHYDATDLSGNIAKRVSRKVLVVENTTGISGAGDERQFNLYPNPSHGVFTISMNSETKMKAEVYNMLGELVHTVSSPTASQTLEIDLGNRADGVYFVRVQAGTENFMRRVVVAK
jgi:PKD repeat protein